MQWGVRHVIAVVFAILCAGCGSFPVAGPLSSDVIHNSSASEQARVDYAVIDVTPAVCAALAKHAPRPFLSAFGNQPPIPDDRVGVGDTLSVTIWEAGNSGLFATVSPAGGFPTPRGASLPPLTVGQDGKIAVPFAGRVAVAGKTIVQIERQIVSALAGKADDPQVVVAMAQGLTNVAIVGGEVAKPSRVPLAVGGEHILDAVADAGGVRIPVNESRIRLTRGSKTAVTTYAALLRHPEENIFLQPGDIVTVSRAPKTFTAFGALGRNYQIPFEADALSVDEAIAKSGGLLDQRADPSGVFVFRYEPAELVAALAPGSHPQTAEGDVPVVYHLDMSQAGGYFLARRFAVHDKDIVYAANAQMNEVQKFLNLFGSVLAPAATGASVSTAVH